MTSDDCDILIAGGGLVGLSLALGTREGPAVSSVVLCPLLLVVGLRCAFALHDANQFLELTRESQTMKELKEFTRTCELA